MLRIRASQPRLGFGRFIAIFSLFSNALAASYELDTNSTSSIKTIAKGLAEDLVSFYHGDEPGQTPGLLPDPYYWWEAGAVMGSLIDYWYYTGDDQYNNLTTQALLHQASDTADFMPLNQTRTEGNDDQGFWGLAVMSAAEYNYPNPDPEKPQWLALAQAVFNTQAARWDPDTCGGGLRWQIFQWNNGFDYKNSISMACFFALGARLALYTGNSSYADWADRSWDWMWDIELINHNSYAVYDGGHIHDECKKKVPYQWSYNAGGMILGAAAMYNYTESEEWKDRLDGMIEGVKVFFTGPDKDIMTEVACEPVNLCNLDQHSFKAYLSRWLAVTTQWAPHTSEVIMPLMRSSAEAAIKQCVGGKNKRMCGLKWNQNKYDGTTGVGQQMAAMEVTLGCMIKDRAAPLTEKKGGTSKGDPGAGGDDIGRTSANRPLPPVSTGDRAGATILTVVILTLLIAAVIWMFLDETSDKSAITQFREMPSSTKAAIAALSAGGAGAAAGAAVLQRNRGNPPVNQHVMAAGAAGTGTDSDGISEKQAQAHVTPMVVGRVRSESQSHQGHQRRMSNMPRGWPHNPSLRASTSFDPDAISPASPRQSRTDLATTAAAKEDATPTVPEDPSGEQVPQTSSQPAENTHPRPDSSAESGAQEGAPQIGVAK